MPVLMAAQPGLGKDAMRSLKHQIVLLVFTVVLGTVVICSFVAFVQFERTLRGTAIRQTELLAADLSMILEANASAALREATELRSLVASDTTPRARRHALTAYLAGKPDLIGAVIWMPDSARRHLIAGPAAESAPSPARIAHARPNSIGVGPVATEGALLFYDISLPLSAETDAERLILRRRFATEDVQRLANEIISAGGAVLLGHTGGDWSDLAQVVDAPRPESDTQYRWKGDSIYDGATVRVPGTPWDLWVGVPRVTTAAPIRRMVANVAGTGLLILAFATLATVLLARRLAAPLDRLNEAIALVAQGEHRDRVPTSGPAEVAALGHTFNEMADRVEEGTNRLEHLVEQRTRELETALSELRNTQEQLVRNERVATLGHLASVVGDELRNPLRTMTNTIYSLEMASHLVPPFVKENYGILRYHMLVAEKIVGDLLDFAQVKAPHTQRVQLSAFLDEQIERLGKLDRILLVREYDTRAVALFVDPLQAGQAIFNVLTNAVQALERGGVITISTAADGSTAVIDIVDTGPGIAAEDLPHIFEPLFTTKARGIGLGLSVARALIEVNGGTITATSQPGEGARFSIQLPAA